jgi:putative ABC transport system ATP-binding protein
MMEHGAETAADSTAKHERVAFSARGLTKVYGMGAAEVHALRGVDLDLHEGELIVLLGPSGSGKSTLLNILGGLDRPTAGTLHFRGRELTSVSDRELTAFRRRHVGFIFQFYNLIPSLTARENVALVTELVSEPMRPEEALQIVGLGERMEHFPAQLSGGEQQRVAVARAVAKRPEVLLCDEPTGALDSATGVRVLEALADINQTLGTTTVVITHNASIAGMADHVIHFGNGRVVSIETNTVKRKASELSW